MKKLAIVLVLCFALAAPAQPQHKHHHHIWKTTRHVAFQVLMVPLYPVFFFVTLGGCIP